MISMEDQASPLSWFALKNCFWHSGSYQRKHGKLCSLYSPNSPPSPHKLARQNQWGQLAEFMTMSGLTSGPDLCYCLIWPTEMQPWGFAVESSKLCSGTRWGRQIRGDMATYIEQPVFKFMMLLERNGRGESWLTVGRSIIGKESPKIILQEQKFLHGPQRATIQAVFKICTEKTRIKSAHSLKK